MPGTLNDALADARQQELIRAAEQRRRGNSLAARPGYVRRLLSRLSRPRRGTDDLVLAEDDRQPRARHAAPASARQSP